MRIQTFRTQATLASLLGLILAIGPTWAQTPKTKKQSADTTAKSKKQDSAGKATKKFDEATIKRALAKRAAMVNAPAKVPKDVESIPIKRTPGRTNLPLWSEGMLTTAITAQQLDELAAAEMSKANEKAERRASDEEFVRRVYLDVLGQLPTPADIAEYASSKDPDKKAKLIDQLLENERYGVNWARYWRDVIEYRQTAGDNRVVAYRAPFEKWLGEQLNKNEPWDKIVTQMISTTGLSHEHPEGMFLGAHGGEAAETAGEASRIFLGIQIACAQCHDHPTDTWKREQFHEFASFFGKTAVRPRIDLREQYGLVIEVAPKLRGGDYRIPNLKDPSDPGEVVKPAFLTGQAYPVEATDQQRRDAAADFITSKKNPYFAKAFVNRMWFELMGQPFTKFVDDLGSQQEVMYPKMFDTLARSFAGSNYDIKKLMRAILNSKVYDRRFAETEGSSDPNIAFRTINPMRLSADQIFDNLEWVLGGGLEAGQRFAARRAAVAGGGPAQRFAGGVRRQFGATFGFDPSADRDSIEGSITQALALMNAPALNGKISARNRANVLAKILATSERDEDVINALYLRTLARKPAAEERDTALKYIKEVGKREEAFEDIFWALLNSTEFLFNH